MKIRQIWSAKTAFEPNSIQIARMIVRFNGTVVVSYFC